MSVCRLRVSLRATGSGASRWWECRALRLLRPAAAGLWRVAPRRGLRAAGWASMEDFFAFQAAQSHGAGGALRVD